jgi:hypothetical protein
MLLTQEEKKTKSEKDKIDEYDECRGGGVEMWLLLVRQDRQTIVDDWDRRWDDTTIRTILFFESA